MLTSETIVKFLNLSTNHEILGGCGEMASKLMLKYCNRSPFWKNGQNSFTQHTVYGVVTVDKCTTLPACTVIWLSIVLFALLSMMIRRYNPTRLHRVLGSAVHVRMVLTICQKRTPISLFQHQFWCHIHHILTSYHILLIFSNKSIIFSHLWEMWLLKSVVYFEPHCREKITLGFLHIVSLIK